MAGKIWPCVMRMMLTAVVSNCLPVVPSTVETNCYCCGEARLGRVMPSSGAILRQVASSRACPTTRCSPASTISGVEPPLHRHQPQGVLPQPGGPDLHHEVPVGLGERPVHRVGDDTVLVLAVFRTPSMVG